MRIDWEGLLDQTATAEELQICHKVKARLTYEEIREQREKVQAHIFLNPLRIDFSATDSTCPAVAYLGPQVPITAEQVESEDFWRTTLEKVRENFDDFLKTA